MLYENKHIWQIWSNKLFLLHFTSFILLKIKYVEITNLEMKQKTDYVPTKHP